MKETLLWQWLTGGGVLGGGGGAELLSLSWLHPIPAWAWVLLALGIGLFSAWSYSRLIGSRWLRSAMTILRTLTLLWLVMLISGPMLVQTRERVEPDRLIWLIDRSGSMDIPPPPGSPGSPGSFPSVIESPSNSLGLESLPSTPGTPQTPATVSQISGGSGSGGGTRDGLVRRELAVLLQQIKDLPEVWSHQRQQYWYGFDEQAYVINPDAIPDVTSAGTNIATALETVLNEHQGHPISAVVLISDGRTPQRLGAELLRKLKQSAVSVFTVPVGSQQSMSDVAIMQVDAPRQAYINDVVPVRVQLSLQPQDQRVDPTRVKVQLIDIQSGNVLDEVSPTDDKLSIPVQLNVKSQEVGSRDWQVKVIYEPDAASAGELNLENNQQLVTVQMIDQPVRVLYIEGYPRWEYRYLKSILMREKSIKSSMFLISADQQFAQEGDVPLSRLPQTAKEFEAYDVIIIGDVPSRHFSLEQLSMIRDQVASGGAGLIWIGGARWTPVTYDSTVLANLLPMRQVSAVAALGNQPLNVIPTELAKSLQVLQLETPLANTSTSTTSLEKFSELPGVLPGGLPGLRWVQQLGELKSVAEVLAMGQFTQGKQDPIPLITSLRYGAGQTLYVASDDFWRWRYAKGDLYYQPFWTQLVRLLGRGRLSQTNQATQLSTAHQRLLLKQSTIVKFTTRDALLLEQNRGTVKILVERMRDGQVVDQIDLLPQTPAPAPGLPGLPGTPGTRESGKLSGLTGETSGGGERVYQVIWQPRHAGRLRLYPADTMLGDSGQVQSFIQVQHPDDEMRMPLPDHELLKRLAADTGGQVVALNKLTDLASMVPNRTRRTPDDIRYPLWHALWVYGLFVLLITMEWILRKVCKLV